MKNQNDKSMVIMGILNVTPDSFSDGGEVKTSEEAVEKALRLIDEGAGIIDVGGESTRPGYTQISAGEEIKRVVPVISSLRKRTDIDISIDTYKFEVAKEAIAAGANIINDIWGFKKDERLAELAASKNIPVILMHNREEPVLESSYSDMEDYLDIVCKELSESVEIADKYGIDHENIILDPGVGFGKTYEQNIAVIKHADRIVSMGFPVLMAASRKSVIGLTLDLPASEREEGTIAISLYAASKGCKYVRVHDVLKNSRALAMWQAIS